MWSHSKLTQYEKCPYALVLKTKVPPTTNVYAQRGIAIHDALSNYLKGTLPEAPKLDHFKDEVEQLRSQNAQSELALYVNEKWEPCDRTVADGIGILDAMLEDEQNIVIIDFKTGKPNALSHQDQSQTYAIIANSHFPEKNITTVFWYLDSGKETTVVYDPKKITTYQAILNTRITRMKQDISLKPRPNRYVCKWCNYKENCEYRHDS